jgi:hypothetical protein
MLSSSSSSPKCILDHALLTIDKALIALLDHCCGVDRAKHIYLDVNYDSLHLSSSSSSGVNALIQQSLQTIHSDISSSSSSSAVVVATNASSILDNSNPSIHSIDIGIDSTQLQQLQSIVSRIAKDFSSSEQSNDTSVIMPVEYVDDVRSSSSSSSTAATTTTTLYDYIKSRFVDDCDNDRVMERHIRLRFLSSLLLLISCGWTFQIARRRRVRMSEGGSIILSDASAEEKKKETVNSHDAVVSHGIHHDNNTEPSRDTDDDDVTILSLHCSLCGRSVCYDMNAVKCCSSSTTSTTTTTTTSGVGSNNHSQMMPRQQQPFDPIHQHRYFCPWINPQSIVPTWFDVLTIVTAPDDREGNRAGDSSDKRGVDGDEEACIENKIKGFEYYMCALNQFRSPAYLHAHVSSKQTVINQSSPSVASSVVVTAETVVDDSSRAVAAAVVTAPTVAISTTTTTTTTTPSTTARDISPEQAYKRIRLILETASVK